jgi:hypothetical protein
MTQLGRDTVKGMAIGALLMGAISTVQALRAGVALGTVLQPILVFALIGLTVGALAGPLVGAAIRRGRRR